MPAVLLNPTACGICAKETTRRCARCKSTPYCCRAHQRKDWSAHSATCTPAPRRRIIWGISLPAFHLRSELVPIVVNENGGLPGTPTSNVLELVEHLGGSKHDSRVISLVQSVQGYDGPTTTHPFNKGTAQQLRPKRSNESIKTQRDGQTAYHLRIFFRDAFRSDGSPINRSVRMLCGARLLADGSLNGGDTPLEWCGNILVMRCEMRDDGEHYLSATHADLEVVKDWLGRYHGETRGG
ncbi:unnamed protein product [Peniophora sp. CBMAI 1063]|nr:unnamed protein product [Peniophora sp. CBMAI 1063]